MADVYVRLAMTLVNILIHLSPFLASFSHLNSQLSEHLQPPSRLGSGSRFLHLNGGIRSSRAPGSSFSSGFELLSIRRAQVIPGFPRRTRGRSLCSDQVGAIPRSAHPRGRYGPAWSGPFGFFFSFLVATFFFYGNFYDLFLI
jgi:hypothetical protein